MTVRFISDCPQVFNEACLILDQACQEQPTRTFRERLMGKLSFSVCEEEKEGNAFLINWL